MICTEAWKAVVVEAHQQLRSRLHRGLATTGDTQEVKPTWVRATKRVECRPLPPGCPSRAGPVQFSCICNESCNNDFADSFDVRAPGSAYLGAHFLAGDK